MSGDETMNENRFDARCRESTCRVCRRSGLLPVLDLGEMPHSDGFLAESQLAEQEPMWPLEVAFCPSCSLVQILETVPPEDLFNADYVYFSSFSESLLEHSRRNALALIEERGLDSGSLVVEIASNDGYMLRNFVEKGIPVLGIDPSREPALAAQKIGVKTMCTFFTRELADDLVSSGHGADLIIANNVLAHVADTNGFVEGLAKLLRDDGVAVIEVPYVRDLIEHGEFDTIYHQHLCYFSVRALDTLFRQHGLFLNRVVELAIHGGSLRLFVSPREGVEESVTRLLSQEGDSGMERHEFYRRFSQAVSRIREDLLALVRELRRQGHRLVGYGAAAKGTILLNYCGLDGKTLEYVVDRNTHKQGKYIPGVRIPIRAPELLLEDMPDHVLLLPWNFRDEILRQQSAYRDRGGRFIIPIPTPVVV